MKTFGFIVAVACLSAAPAAVWACPGAGKAEGSGCGQGAKDYGGCGNKQQEASVRDISVDQLASLIKSGAHKVSVLDANSDKTRQAYGQIPGARLLSSYADYDVSRELPTEAGAMIVFYCANAKCSASHKAAQRALDAGYTNVYVLRDGIAGWLNAGQPVQVPSA